MSRYFDHFDREVRLASIRNTNDRAAFLRELNALEDKMARDCELFAGDIDTPQDVRECIVAIISLYKVDHGSVASDPKRADLALACRSSMLSREMHALWHDIASMRYEMRYGLVMDDPAHAVRRRDEYAETRRTRKTKPREHKPFLKGGRPHPLAEKIREANERRRAAEAQQPATS